MQFKIKTGYDEGQFIGIDETELEMAIRAQVTGKVALLKNGTLGGNHIISILPDEDAMPKAYNPHGPDFIQGRAVEEHRLAIQNAGEAVRAQIEGLPVPVPRMLPVRTFGAIRSVAEILKSKSVSSET